MSEQDAEALGIRRPARPARLMSGSTTPSRTTPASAMPSGTRRCCIASKTTSGSPPPSPGTRPICGQGAPAAVANAIIEDIAAGIESDKGRRHYSDAPATKPPRRADAVVRKHVPSLNERQARAVIKTWVNNAVLYRESYFDPVERKDRGGLFVTDAKRPGARGR